jgi:hypothetical protein
MPDGPRGRWRRWLGLLVRSAAVAFVVGWALSRWDARTGYTAMPRFGERFAERRIPQLAGHPIAPSAGDGYDGQWYAQLAVNPRVTDSTVIRALDKPAYRARRIAVPLLAHLLGGGAPWRTLQLFVLLHVAAWWALAAVLWRRLPLGDWRATAAWCGAVLGTGALDSLRMTLTDLPAVLGLVLAILAVEAHRTTLATVAMLLAGFTRELSLGGLLALQRGGDRPWGGWGIWWTRAAIAAPVVAWCGWLLLRTPGAVGHEGNIAWPGVAMAQPCGRRPRRPVVVRDRRRARPGGAVGVRAPALARCRHGSLACAGAPLCRAVLAPRSRSVGGLPRGGARLPAHDRGVCDALVAQ